MRHTTDNAHRNVPFSSNAVRLSWREWLVALAVIAAVLVALPVVWEHIEPLRVREDYRLPYALSNDYWVYARVCETLARPANVAVVGDSVIWGHYVAPHETLSAHLNALDAGPRSFANLGVDGIHPAAMAGLVTYYGRALAGCDVLLHGNLLWMSSPRHDLTVRKEFAFNHPRLVPQFMPRIPCYAEPIARRLDVATDRYLPFAAWAEHLRVAYFDSVDLGAWMLDHPYANPAASVTLDLPSPYDPPAAKPDARPWTEKGVARFGPAWVELDESLQWASFRATVERLRNRACRVFVLVGPFNEHMLTAESLETYEKRKRDVAARLGDLGVPYHVARPLPSDLYADASHPLADGYRLLAERLLASEAFRRFAAPGGGPE